MVSAISTASAGMQNATRLFERAAGQVANPGASGSADTLTAVADTITAKNSFELNTAVLRNAIQMQKQVLDILV